MKSSKYDKELEKAYEDLKRIDAESHKDRNELLRFFVGLLMFGAGLFMIFQNLVVTSSWGSGYIFHIGSFNLPNGMVMLPLIIGIAMLFLMDRKIYGWIVVALGIVIILAAVLMSVRLYWRTTSAYIFIIMFGLTAAGGAMMLRELFRKK